MLVTLIHNPGAGDEGEDWGDHLKALIREAGHDVRYQSSDEHKWEDSLEDPGELVVAAGGDGTVGKVARTLSGRHAAMTVLPLGTANNIAKTFGLTGIEFEELIAGWSNGRRVDFDLGVARGPWGSRQFVEGVGTGLIADTMARLDSEYDPTMARADGANEEIDAVLRILRRDLQHFQTRDLKITLDGQDLSGSYLLVEAMNIKFLGPNLYLAPEADPGDGLLDIVLLPLGDKNELLDYLSDHLKGELSPPGLRIVRGRHLQMMWDGSDTHIDDEAWPIQDSLASVPALIDVEIIPRALEFLLPG